MTRLIPSFGTLFTMGTIGGAMFMAACTGKIIGGDPSLTPVSPGEINQPVVACGTGYAHPNVCCAAGPSQVASCGNYPDAPFQACGASTTTYPDPRSCCPLDGSGDCIAPPSGGGSAGGCAYACPPGQYEAAGSPGTCCFDDGSTTVCSVSTGIACVGPSSGSGSGSGWSGGSSSGGSSSSGGGWSGGSSGGSSSSSGGGWSGGSSGGSSSGGSAGVSSSSSSSGYYYGGSSSSSGYSGSSSSSSSSGWSSGSGSSGSSGSGGACPPPFPPGGPVCNCPVCLAGAECDCVCGGPSEPPPPVCNACPAGWQVPEGEPLLCCNDSSGVIECFSQGGWSSGGSSGGGVAIPGATTGSHRGR